eukprot:NODE_5105_length_292_cov_30.707819_g4660_i0.p2 GENE.NODE_5105_length_292_cov_30.707819_g4660_i0~~NODE_5105_length_292_cov_30.707819_g4660_i0.p2  ORF type:complete len:78 (+),score=25.94 NODE_5105_length_292_cov_30.707819_g4660_i0:32-235(+)
MGERVDLRVKFPGMAVDDMTPTALAALPPDTKTRFESAQHVLDRLQLSIINLDEMLVVFEHFFRSRP